jgi:hypothetical protein
MLVAVLFLLRSGETAPKEAEESDDDFVDSACRRHILPVVSVFPLVVVLPSSH